MNKQLKMKDIVGKRETHRRNPVVSGPMSGCDCLSSRTRYYKTPGLKDEKVFYSLSNGHLEKKMKSNDEFDGLSVVSSLYYL